MIEQKYAGLLDGLFGAAETLHTSIEIDYQDGRKRQLNAELRVRRLAIAAADRVPQKQRTAENVPV